MRCWHYNLLLLLTIATKRPRVFCVCDVGIFTHSHNKAKRTPESEFIYLKNSRFKKISIFSTKMVHPSQSIKETQKRVLFLIQVSISIALFYLIFEKINLNQIQNVTSSINLGYFLLALVLKFSSVLLSSAMLGVVLEIFNHFIPFKELSRIYFSSFFYNSIGIGTLGGDFYRWYKLCKINGSKETSSLIIITEKIIIFSVLLSFVFVGFTQVILQGSYIMLFLLIPLPFVFLYAISQLVQTIMRSISHVKTLKNFYPFETLSTEIAKITLTPPALLSRGILFSSLFYALNIAAFALIVYSVDKTIPLSASMFILPIVILFTSLPISFQGFGLREITIAYLFPAFGYSPITGTVVALIYLLANIALAGASGIYTISKKIKIQN